MSDTKEAPELMAGALQVSTGEAECVAVQGLPVDIGTRDHGS